MESDDFAGSSKPWLQQCNRHAMHERANTDTRTPTSKHIQVYSMRNDLQNASKRLVRRPLAELSGGSYACSPLHEVEGSDLLLPVARVCCRSSRSFKARSSMEASSAEAGLLADTILMRNINTYVRADLNLNPVGGE